MTRLPFTRVVMRVEELFGRVVMSTTDLLSVPDLPTPIVRTNTLPVDQFVPLRVSLSADVGYTVGLFNWDTGFEHSAVFEADGNGLTAVTLVPVPDQATTVGRLTLVSDTAQQPNITVPLSVRDVSPTRLALTGANFAFSNDVAARPPVESSAVQPVRVGDQFINLRTSASSAVELRLGIPRVSTELSSPPPSAPLTPLPPAQVPPETVPNPDLTPTIGPPQGGNEVPSGPNAGPAIGPQRPANAQNPPRPRSFVPIVTATTQQDFAAGLGPTSSSPRETPVTPPLTIVPPAAAQPTIQYAPSSYGVVPMVEPQPDLGLVRERTARPTTLLPSTFEPVPESSPVGELFSLEEPTRPILMVNVDGSAEGVLAKWASEPIPEAVFPAPLVFPIEPSNRRWTAWFSLLAVAGVGLRAWLTSDEDVPAGPPTLKRTDQVA